LKAAGGEELAVGGVLEGVGGLAFHEGVHGPSGEPAAHLAHHFLVGGRVVVHGGEIAESRRAVGVEQSAVEGAARLGTLDGLASEDVGMAFVLVEIRRWPAVAGGVGNAGGSEMTGGGGRVAV